MDNDNTSVQLTVTDLNIIKNILDISCSRGAFRANEMQTVGLIYDKLTAFLDGVVALAQTEASSLSQEPQVQSNPKGEAND